MRIPGLRHFLPLAAAIFATASPIAAQEALPEPVPLEAYGQLPGVGDVAISDTGEHLAILATINGTRLILILDRDLKLVRSITADDSKFRGFRFVGDEALLVFTSTTVNVTGFVADKYEMTQAIVLPLDSSREATAIFADNSKLNNAIHGNHGVRLVDGRWKGYFGALEFERDTTRMSGYVFDHGRPYLYEYDFAELDEKRVARAAPERIWRDWLIAPDGSIAATFDIDRNSGRWSIRNVDNDTIAEGLNSNGDAGLMGLGHDATTLIYSTENPDTGETDWFEVPLAGGEAQPFLEHEQVERLYWNRTTGEFLGYMEDSAGQRQVFHDPGLQERAQLITSSFAGTNANIAEWTADMSRVILHTQGNGDSGTWYYVDVEARRADPIGYDRPIASSQVGPVSTVEYAAQDGLEMDGILTLPPGREARGLPVVVLPHGGPHSRDTEGFDWWAQAFASRGYAVFQPNFRGSTGRGESFMLAAHGEWGRKMQTDISDGLAVLVEQGIVDPERACIVGASYGGYAALAGVTIQQGLYRCAVSVAGVSDLWIMYRTDSREASGSRLVRRSLQEELGPDEHWNTYSPRDQAAHADAPILLIHGIDDTVVPFEQSDKMADALKNAGKPYRLVELAGEDHWLTNAETRMQMLQEAVAFVEEHNPAD